MTQRKKKGGRYTPPKRLRRPAWLPTTKPYANSPIPTPEQVIAALRDDFSDARRIRLQAIDIMRARPRKSDSAA